MGAILVVNVLALWLANKELKLSTVDPGLAAALGFSPAVLHYGLMALVSVTAVGAFNAVGSILVVALMIAPPATAYLLVERFVPMLWLSAAIAAASAVAGYGAAYALDTSIAGAMATVTGVFFAIAFLAAPGRGLVAQMRRRRGQRTEFAVRMLLVHLLHHEHREEASEECRVGSLNRHLRWSEPFTRQIVRHAESGRLVSRRDELLGLTDVGRETAQRLLVEGPKGL
jgi:manganese/zinc/iron transport system permease protein